MGWLAFHDSLEPFIQSGHSIQDHPFSRNLKEKVSRYIVLLSSFLRSGRSGWLTVWRGRLYTKKRCVYTETRMGIKYSRESDQGMCSQQDY